MRLNFFENFFLYLIYLPLLILANIIAHIFSKFLPVKVSSFFTFKSKLPKVPTFKVRPILVHAASGEIDYARTLIRKFQLSHPHIPIVVTYSSDTGKILAGKVSEAAFTSPLPLDLPGRTSGWLKKLNPRLIIFSKTDFWPMLLTQAHKQKIPTIVISLGAKGDLTFWQSVCVKLFDLVFSQDLVTTKMLSTLGITSFGAGDTRIDQALYRRRQHEKKITPETSDRKFAIKLVAGSTWSTDESVLLDVILKKHDVQFFLVPHEIHEDQIQNIESKLSKHGIGSERWTKNGLRRAQVIIVDTWGQLADLYQMADLAFVGGSFKRKVHSVMEPLVWGCPVILGPNFRNNYEAVIFKDLVFSKWPGVSIVNNATEFSVVLLNYLRLSVPQREEIQVQIRKEIESRSGASDEIYRQLTITFGDAIFS